MKNLIDELHKLDEYEYKVSKDFSKNVMESIRMNKKSNKVNNVISMASIGLVACLAVFAFNNVNIKNNFEMNNTEGLESVSYTNNAYYDTNIQVSSIDEMDSTSKNTINDSVSEDSVINESANKENNTKYNTENATEVHAVKKYSGEKYNEIKKVLDNEQLEYEMFEAEFKVKTNIEKVTNLLENYTNVVMEVQDEYIIIHVKE